MIRKSPVGVSPNLAITIGDAAVNYESLMSLSLDLKENEHDMCTFTMTGVPPRFITDYIGKSVYVSMDTGSSFVSRFWGTIEHAAPSAVSSKGKVNDSLFQEVRFTAFGASYRMRGVERKPWHGATLVDVCTQLSTKYGFSVDVPADPLIYSTMAQRESDWKFLVRYASLMGYSVTVHGTHIHVFDPYKAAGRLPSIHRLYSPARSSTTPEPGQIVEFSGTFTQSNTDTIATVHQDNGTVFDVRTSDAGGTPARYSTLSDMTADTYDEAVRILAYSEKTGYDYKAHASVVGSAGMVPGGIANLDRYDAAFDGLWYISGVRHDVRSGSFLTDIDMFKNVEDTYADRSAAAFRAAPEPNYINNEWTSSRRVVNAY
jgi:hypothetical protein